LLGAGALAGNVICVVTCQLLTIPVTTPESRKMAVPASVRVFAATDQDRVLIVDSQDRTLVT
jgi:hypothetical protein